LSGRRRELVGADRTAEVEPLQLVAA
jgi:hypothetical protein